MELFKSWKFWVFLVAAAIANTVVGNLVSWPLVAGAWAGVFAASNEKLFKVDR